MAVHELLDGVPAAIAAAQKIAGGGKEVSVASASIAQQALDAGLLDGIYVRLVPVLLGEGIPYFANLTAAPHRSDDPSQRCLWPNETYHR